MDPQIAATAPDSGPRFGNTGVYEYNEAMLIVSEFD